MSSTGFNPRAVEVVEVVLHCWVRPGEARQSGTVFSCDVKNEWEAGREEVLGKP